MPLARDPQGGGTQKDGTLHKEYCSYCYRAGTFTEPDITMGEMMDKVQGKLNKMWIPPFIGKFFTRSIPQLKRWRNRY